MEQMKKIRSLLLAVVLLLGLSACGQKEETGQELVYLPEDIAFTTALNRVSSACISGDSLYLLGAAREPMGEAGHRDRWALFRVPLEGGAGEEIPFEAPFPKGNDDEMYHASIRAGADGAVWVLDDTVFGGRDCVYILRKLNRDGEELYRFDSRSGEGDLLSRMGWSVWSLSDIATDASGDLFARSEGVVAALDGEGNILYTLKVDIRDELYLNAMYRFVALGDGRLGLLASRKNEDGAEEILLQTIDKEARDWGEAYHLPANVQRVWPGDENALFYYQDKKSLYAWHGEEAEARWVLDWMDARLDRDDVGSLAFLADGRIGVVCCSYNTLAAEVRYVLLSETDASQAPPRKELLLGCISLDSDDRALINQFNSTSPDCYVTVEDYAVYQDDTGYLDWNASRTKMATKIAAGEIPDLLDMDGLPLRQFGSKGILEDLWPYIDNDPELSREDLMLRPLEAASQDGKLYLLSDTFWIETLVGRKSIVGDRMGWTYGDFLEAWAAMPPDSVLEDTRTGMLQTLLQVNADAFLDWDAGICHFDGAEFRAMLEFCGRLPAERSDRDIWTAMFDGEALEMNTWLGSFDGIMFDSVSFHKGLCGGEMTYIGYPTESGQVGSAFGLGRELAMTAACADKDGAWSFLRTLLLPKGREVDYENFLDKADFAINKEDFRRMLEQAMTPAYAVDGDGNYRLDAEGNRIEEPKNGISFGGFHYYRCDIYATTQADYEQFMALYEATEVLNDYNSALTDIITEIAGAYFAGDRSLDETASLIQNRANLYITEQK
ncbi:MAG: extracellular solute-binding protein [Oscillibacter sp.]|nr:extracellular solute-binding protein [Oscillibacter sp.]